MQRESLFGRFVRTGHVKQQVSGERVLSGTLAWPQGLSSGCSKVPWATQSLWSVSGIPRQELERARQTENPIISPLRTPQLSGLRPLSCPMVFISSLHGVASRGLPLAIKALSRCLKRATVLLPQDLCLSYSVSSKRFFPPHASFYLVNDSSYLKCCFLCAPSPTPTPSFLMFSESYHVSPLGTTNFTFSRVVIPL